MPDQTPQANPNPKHRDNLPGAPAVSAAELAAAVLSAAHSVAQSSAGDVTGSVESPSAAAAPDDAAATTPLAVPAENNLRVVAEPATESPMADASPDTPVAEPATDDELAEPEASALEPVEASPAETDDGEKEPEKKPGLGPRWSYIITRGLVVALIWAFFAYVFDPLVRFGAVQSAQSVAGAKVDVEHFSTGFFPPRIHIQNVAVANRKEPGTNLVEFETLEGKVDGFALMKKSYVLEKATVSGLRWGTERSDSGLLEGEDAPEEDADADAKSEFQRQLEAAAKEWAKSLLGRAAMKYDPKNLETYVLADQLEDEWKTDFDDLEVRVGDVEARAKKLKELFDVAKRDPLRNLPKIDQIMKDGLRLKIQLKDIRTDIGRLPPKAQQDLNALNSARQRDTDRVQSEIKDLVLSEDKLSEFLLGPELHHRITQAISWLKWTDERVDRFGTTKPKRTRGEIIPFTDRNPLPTYLVRLIEVSGEGDIAGNHLSIQGTISDVTNDPVLHGKPTIVRLEGRGGAIVKLHAMIDRTQKLPSNELNLSWSLPHPTEETMGDDDTLSVVVHADSTEWTVNLRTVDEELSGTIVLRQKPVRLEARLKEGTDERLRQIVESSVAGVDEVQATVTLSGTVRDPKWKLRTTLGRKILRGVERGVNDALSAQKEALVAKLDGELQSRQQEFLGKLNGRYGALAEQLKLNDALLSQVNARELIQRVSGGRFDPRKIFK